MIVAWNTPVVATVAVAPTSTVIVSSIRAPARGRRLMVQIKNTDGSQTVNASILGRLIVGSGDWDTFDNTQLDAIGAGETRLESFDIMGYGEIRITGAASGAGCNVEVAIRLLEEMR